MHFVRLTSAEDPIFPPAMELYRASFPAHEWRSLPSQQAILSHPQYHFNLIYDGEAFVGLLLCWQLEGRRYVEHFCVLPAHRGKQYGARALALLAADGGPVVLEIDPPNDLMSQRRRAFYLRAGYRENPYPHIHPPYSPGVPGHALVVLSYPEALSEGEYAAFLRGLTQVVMAEGTL